MAPVLQTQEMTVGGAQIRIVLRPENLKPDDKRVITRLFDPHNPRRIRAMLNRVMRLDKQTVAELLASVLEDFGPRHRDIEAVLLENYQSVVLPHYPELKVSRERQLLLGSYYTMEYSIESAALFNPAIVPHPDQSDLPAGSVRFLMSLRATGEGHVSSIVFRCGVLSADCDIQLDPPPRYAYTAKPIPDRFFDKHLFFRKLMEMGVYEELVAQTLENLPDQFNLDQLRDAINQVRQQPDTPRAYKNVAADMLWLAYANYELEFPSDSPASEIVIFPATRSESHGMEDLRLTCFTDEDGQTRYCGTYTAYDGFRTLPMMLETSDFRRFQVHTLNGQHAKNKGMALFPRKVNDCYMMIARHDGENLFLLTSDNIHFWNDARKLQGPAEPWEFVQIGNCGSPLETDAGWLLLTHGVGPVRQYAIGALLLDRDDPGKVIGRMRKPLLSPLHDQRQGYVPNVVYTCGSMIHQDQLVIPYAVSDSRTSFATINARDLIHLLLENGP
ncbi:MAG: glycosidase [Planctomycetes bacterium]|nr:glycosidase [Planctomycetota bacterium]